MGLNLDTTAVTAVLKDRYTKKKIETLAFESPAVGMMPKAGDYGGALYVGALRNAVTSSRSTSDATAFTTGSPSKYQQWLCPWFEDYASANITGGAIDRAKGDANALVDALTGEFDGAFIALGISLGSALWGNGGGAIGQISTTSTVASLTITLANINDIVKFYVGQTIAASSDDGTGGAGVRSGTATLTGVNVNLGTLTVAGSNWSTQITSLSTGDYLFWGVADYAAKVPGVPAWIPNPSVSTSSTLYTSFNSVVRTSDPTRLAGVNYAGNGAPKSETLVQLAMLVGRMGGKPSHCFVNPVDYADLARELGTRATITTETAYENPQIGFAGIQVAMSNGRGMIKIFEDAFVPQGYFWLLNMAEWLIPSMGDVPKVLGAGIDNMEWLRVSGADAYQMRAAYRLSTYCSAPGHQGAGSW